MMGLENASWADVEQQLLSLINGKAPAQPAVSFRPVAPISAALSAGGASSTANASSSQQRVLSEAPATAVASSSQPPVAPSGSLRLQSDTEEPASSVRGRQNLPEGWRRVWHPGGGRRGGYTTFVDPSGRSVPTIAKAIAAAAESASHNLGNANGPSSSAPAATTVSRPSSRGRQSATRGNTRPPRVASSGSAPAAAADARPPSRGRKTATRGDKSATRGEVSRPSRAQKTTTRGTAPPRVEATSEAPGPALPAQDLFTLTAGLCGTLGCVYRDNHLGPCSNAHVHGKRKRT